jgi:hypothetical protein
MEVRDPLYVFDFIQRHLLSEGSHRYSEKKLKNIGWLMSTEGEFRNTPFGLLKPQLNSQYN